MQRGYQLDKQRAVQEFRRFATGVNPTIQMVLPLAGIAGMRQEGQGERRGETWKLRAVPAQRAAR
ncbi:MAG: hypothetical protein ABSF98_02930 [Bryobacteraceae bacterium]|jgi:hypothetical protein